MIRTFHRWPGLIAAIILIILAVSGTALSVFPTLDRFSTPTAVSGQTVAEVAALAQELHPGVEQIKRAPSGKITVWWFDGNTPGAAVIDPTTGLDVGSADQSATEQWLTSLHRSLFMDDNGRIVMAIAAFALLLLALSGSVLVARRVGGWSRWFSRQRGPWPARLHTELARIAVPVLMLSALTALWMTAATFDLLPIDTANPVFPSNVSGQTGFAPSNIVTLQTTPITDLRDLTFPASGDTTDVFTLTTAKGMGYIDQGNGRLLDWSNSGPWAKIFEWIYLLHTGQGASIWGLVLGLMTLSIPALAVTGITSWVKSRQRRPKLRGMVAKSRAETVILVGSEGGSTWGFATTLAHELQIAGQSVHVAPLSSFAPEQYRAARQIVVMTATWGDGAAPSSARGALDRLAQIHPTVPLAVLGFGDSSFPAFSAFSDSFAASARSAGWSFLLAPDRIDRQSPQEFTRWGRAFGEAIGLSLTLNHHPIAPQIQHLTLLSRRNYGEAIQAPASILRFAVPKVNLWQRLTGRGFGRFNAGDLLGILPDGASVPRYYSLASGSIDGFVEIAVRQHPGGLCSGQLMALQEGQTVQAFLRPNPDFQPDRGIAPLILIGAGTGIGPLAGFIRSHGARRPIHLWFGARHPDADLLYGPELEQWSNGGQLSGLRTAFSRSEQQHYVQDALRQDGDTLRRLINLGAKIMVCGGRDMAQGVREALSDILAPQGMTSASLKTEGRYVEDVY